MFDWLKELLTNNQFAQGGLLIAVASFVFYQCRQVPLTVWSQFKRVAFIEYEIQDLDRVYSWVSRWLAEQGIADRARRTTVISRWVGKKGPSQIASTHTGQGGRSTRPTLHWIPGTGLHLFRFKGHWLLINRSRDDNGGGAKDSKMDSLMMKKAYETFYIYGLKRSRSVIREMVTEARDFAVPDNDGEQVNIYYGNYGHWTHGKAMVGRSLDSVVLHARSGLDLMDHLAWFRSNREWFASRGVPWQLGFLLYGEPGNGKTSLIKAVATEQRMNIGIISLSDPDLSDSNLQELLGHASSDMIVVLEDIDCIFQERQKGDDAQGNKLTFSGLLNSLDGIMSGDGRVVIMTTNHLDKLDPALIRPGRVDMQVQLKNPNASMAAMLYDRFNPDATAAAAAEFGLDVVTRGLSMAQTQGLLLDATRAEAEEDGSNGS